MSHYETIPTRFQLRIDGFSLAHYLLLSLQEDQMNKLKGSGIARLLVRATLGECGFSQVAEFTVSHLATLWSGNFRPRDDTRRAVIFGYLRARGAILH